MTTQKILYLDLDNTVVDFVSGINNLDPADKVGFENDLDEVPHIFSLMDPMPGALEAYKILAKQFDTYILSTAPWKNPQAWHDKVKWVQHHLDSLDGGIAHKRLILTHHKNLNRGEFLVDDRPNNGADKFTGEWIHFGTGEFTDWDQVTAYLLARA